MAVGDGEALCKTRIKHEDPYNKNREVRGPIASRDIPGPLCKGVGFRVKPHALALYTLDPSNLLP